MSNEVINNEIVSRFILQSNHIRRIDNTVKLEAFMPINLKLSVIRNCNLKEHEIWHYGLIITRERKTEANLYGRAEIHTSVLTENDLIAVAAPSKQNPYHADVVNWQQDIPSQKMKALEISVKSVFKEFSE